MHVAITGASSGIGEALAREYFARGALVTLVARRRPLLETLAAEANSHVHVVQADLANVATCTDWLEEAERVNGPIDVLINNAGAQIVSSFLATDWAEGERLLALDLHAPLKLSQAVLRGMAARRRGTLVDIASMAAISPTPGMSFYNAAKGGLAAASEGLRAELKPLGVHVLTVYPGPVRTELERKGREAYQDSWLVRLLMAPGRAEVLARKVARAVERRSPRVIYPWLNVFGRHFPGPTRWLLDAFTPPLKER